MQEVLEATSHQETPRIPACNRPMPHGAGAMHAAVQKSFMSGQQQSNEAGWSQVSGQLILSV